MAMVESFLFHTTTAQAADNVHTLSGEELNAWQANVQQHVVRRYPSDYLVLSIEIRSVCSPTVYAVYADMLHKFNKHP